MTTTTSLARRRTAALIGAVALTVALAGCGNGVRTTASGDMSPSTSPSGSTAASPSTKAAPRQSTQAAQPAPAEPSTSKVSAPEGPPVCAADNLDVTVHRPSGGGTAGSTYLLVELTNTAAFTCTLDGHPGVSFVGNGNGTQLGTPADRTGGTERVVLADGATGYALLRVGDAGAYDAGTCAPTRADGFRIYPPDSRSSTFVAYTMEACQEQLGAGHSQLSISAVSGSV